jgi:hypothetical protein
VRKWNFFAAILAVLVVGSFGCGDTPKNVIEPPLGPGGKADVADRVQMLGEIKFGGEVTGEFVEDLQFDAYTFYTSDNARITIETTQKGSSQSLDNTLFIYGPANESGKYGTSHIATDDDSGYSLHAKIASFSLTEGGGYLVVTGTPSGTGRGKYRIELRCDSGDCETEKCDDGTPNGECSDTKPKFCLDGTLVDDCSICGCASEQDLCKPSGSCEQIIEIEDCAQGMEDRHIDILVDASSYKELDFELTRLRDDIVADTSMSVCILARQWHSAVEVRRHLQERHSVHSLVGAILIGEVPAAVFLDEYGMNPSDWYYQDLDGVYGGPDEDGYLTKPDKYGLAHKRDIWTGRLYPPAAAAAEDRITMLRNYLNRNHLYRTGASQYQRRALVFPLVIKQGSGFDYDDIRNYADCLSSPLDLYASTDQVDLLWHGTTEQLQEQYLDRLDDWYEYIEADMHGTAISNYIYDSVTWDIIRDVQPNAMVIKMTSCSNGHFLHPNYVAGYYLFSGETLGIFAPTAPVASAFGTIFVNCNDPSQASQSVLAYGAMLGEYSKHDKSRNIITLFGDPTLRLRPILSQGRVRQDRLSLSLGSIKCSNGFIEGELPIHNDGSGTLEFRFVESEQFIDGRRRPCTPMCFNPMEIWLDWEESWTFSFLAFLHRDEYPIVIPPGESYLLRFRIGTDDCIDEHLGEWTWYLSLSTNDGLSPFIDIRVSGILAPE